MLYNLKIEVPKAITKVQFNVELPEPVVREFQYILKQFKLPSTKVVVKMLEEFISEHRSQAQLKQTEMFHKTR